MATRGRSFLPAPQTYCSWKCLWVFPFAERLANSPSARGHTRGLPVSTVTALNQAVPSALTAGAAVFTRPLQTMFSRVLSSHVTPLLLSFHYRWARPALFPEALNRCRAPGFVFPLLSFCWVILPLSQLSLYSPSSPLLSTAYLSKNPFPTSLTKGWGRPLLLSVLIFSSCCITSWFLKTCLAGDNGK